MVFRHHRSDPLNILKAARCPYGLIRRFDVSQILVRFGAETWRLWNETVAQPFSSYRILMYI